jgi:thioredoxin 1
MAEVLSAHIKQIEASNILNELGLQKKKYILLSAHREENIDTKENFESEVMNSDRPVLIDFWAPWCGPCRMLSPTISEIAEEYGDKVKVCKVNVDEQGELASTFGVMSIPTLVVIKEGKVVNSAVGVRPKDQIVSMFS